jgi:hypothetical protein
MPFDPERIKARIIDLAKGIDVNFINFDVVVNKVLMGIYSGMRNLLFVSNFYRNHHL